MPTIDLRSSAAVEALLDWFGECPGAVVAFSGGVDSSVVAEAAFRALGAAGMLAVIADSPSLKRSELHRATALASERGYPLQVVNPGEMANPQYQKNPVNRCYFCKTHLYRKLVPIARRKGWWALNGQNLDDAGDYRPGIRAAGEYEVRAPLAECRISKAGVREIARMLGLPAAEKPASPCLSSRIPYGEVVTVEKLARIEAAEEWLSGRGFPASRVRDFGGEARVEVPLDRVPELEAIQSDLAEGLRQIGFRGTVIASDGLVSGRLNQQAGVAVNRGHRLPVSAFRVVAS